MTTDNKHIDKKQTEIFPNYILYRMINRVVRYINKRIEMSCRAIQKV